MVATGASLTHLANMAKLMMSEDIHLGGGRAFSPLVPPNGDGTSNRLAISCTPYTYSTSVVSLVCTVVTHRQQISARCKSSQLQVQCGTGCSTYQVVYLSSQPVVIVGLLPRQHAC